MAWLSPKEILQLGNLLAELRHLLLHLFGENSSVISFKAVYGKGNNMTEFEIEKN